MSSGSISHKGNLAVGTVRLAEYTVTKSATETYLDKPDTDTDTETELGYIGVDLERCSNKASAKLGKRLLTTAEQETLGTLVIKMGESDERTEAVTSAEDVLLRFSFKEV